MLACRFGSFLEPFGFHDGISQPVIQGLSKGGRGARALPAGEFVLGYPNAYGQRTDRPLLPASLGGGLDQGGDEAPGAHVLRLLLAPDDLGRGEARELAKVFLPIHLLFTLAFIAVARANWRRTARP